MLELHTGAGAVLSVGFHSECINTAEEAWRIQHLVLLTKSAYCDRRTQSCLLLFPSLLLVHVCEQNQTEEKTRPLRK